MKNKSKKILVVAAHPDDEILGCGGTIAHLVEQGYEAYTLILGEGITSRDPSRNTENRKSEIEILRSHIIKANETIGVKECFIHDFPDNRFDTIPFLDIVKKIEQIKTQIRPQIIFTHYEKDLNIDHQITARAVLTATRPVQGESVIDLYSFEILSSTEWAFPNSFSPNVFYNIESSLEKKLKAMSFYESELTLFPHPRSLRGISNSAARWGQCVGLNSAEAFICLRSIRGNHE